MKTTLVDAPVIAGYIAKQKTDDVMKLVRCTGWSLKRVSEAIDHLQDSNVPTCCGAKMYRERGRFPRLACSLFCGRHRMWQLGKWIHED